MEIWVDQLKCDTTGICVTECPTLFRFQEGSKKAEALLTQVPKALEETCVRIAGRCPTGAIVLEK